MVSLLCLIIATVSLGGRARARGWTEGWSRRGAIASAYALATIAFFWQFWLLDDVAMPRGGGDLVSFLYPTYRFAADELQAGRFPFWNPRLFGGMPFAADLQSGLYYPPNLVAFLVARPFEYGALELLAVLHYPVAALGAYALARELALPRLGAFAAGLAFAFAGFPIAHLGHYNMLAAASWSPFVLVFLLRAMATGRIGWSAIGGGAYALVLLAGHTQTALYLALAAAIVWVTLLLRRRGWVAAVSLPAVLVIGAMASAILLLPAYELTRLSIRSDITYPQASEFAASPLGLITFLVPQFFGDGPNDYWGLRWSLQESYGYVGIAGLVVAACALLPGRDRRLARLLAIFALFWLLVALGETTSLHGWLYRLVPGFDKVRAPGRALLFVDLSLALLIGMGIGRVSAPVSRRIRPALRPMLAGLAIVLAAGTLFVAPLFYYAALTSQDRDAVIVRRLLGASGALNVSLVFLALATLLVWRWRRAWRSWLAPLAVGLVFLDLLVANARFNPTREDILAGYRNDGLIDFLRAGVGTQRIDSRTGIADTLQPDLALLAGFDDVSGLFNPLTLREFDRYWEGLGSRSTPAYDLLAVRYVVAKRDAPLDAAKFRRVFDAPNGLAVFENLSSLPRAFVTARAEQRTEGEIAARLRDPAFKPRELLLTDDTVDTNAGSAGGEVVSVERVGSNDVSVRLRDVTGGYLVLSETSYPGWQASVDGRDVPIVRAYDLFQAVRLPAGAARVQFVFRPTRWNLAVASSAVGWLAIVVAAGLLLRQRASGGVVAAVRSGGALWS